MRIAVIADVHANRVALDAVREDLPPVDGLVCAGDVVGYNPWPAECVERLRDRDVPTVAGNHDRAASTSTEFRFNDAAAAGIKHAKERLSRGQRRWLRLLPDRRTEFDDRVRIVHGHPDDPDRYTRPSMFGPDLLDGEDVLVMGHTHVQHHEVYDEGIALNPGSVGQPRDGDPRAAYAVVDLDAMTVEERRVEYDVEAVVRAVEEAGLPPSIGRRLRDGK